MRAKDFNSIGGFDPVYYFCYEDVDLCLKVRYNLKKKVLYAANAIVLHKESVTQNKHKTSGKLQKKGIEVFKKKWMSVVDIDVFDLAKNNNISNIDVSFVTCINDIEQYNRYVVGSLFLNDSKKNYEIVPVLNVGNKYSAAKALNIGINKARANIVVLCHQDVLFYKGWIDMMFKRIKEIGKSNWGVIGTAGITTKDKTFGVVYNLKERFSGDKREQQQLVKYKLSMSIVWL